MSGWRTGVAGRWRRARKDDVEKELLKATYTAARAELQVNEEIAASAAAGQDAAAQYAASQNGASQQASTEALARLLDAAAQIERELGREPLPEGLLELRPGAPGDSEIRLIFAIEPPGTALLISVLEGRDTARDQYRDAVTLSGAVLLEARAGQAPEASARGYDDTRSLAEQRIRLGLTQTEVAERMGPQPDQVAALGGRLELTAEFGGDRVVLR